MKEISSKQKNKRDSRIIDLCIWCVNSAKIYNLMVVKVDGLVIY